MNYVSKVLRKALYFLDSRLGISKDCAKVGMGSYYLNG